MDRRQILKLLALSPLCQLTWADESTVTNNSTSYDDLLKEIIDLEQSSFSEGIRESYSYYHSKGIAPRGNKSDKKIDQKAIDLIIASEVTSQNVYNKKYRSPIWPKSESGITIGIGYDIGYVKQAWLKNDWQGIICKDEIEILEMACNKKGKDAKKLLKNFGDLKKIQITWEQAEQQFKDRLLPLYIGETIARLPNANLLNEKCLGALVSLVFNRGGDFTTPRKMTDDMDRRKEKREIYNAMSNKNYAVIPEQIRKMKRLWENNPDTKGLVLRREYEALLFEEGLVR